MCVCTVVCVVRGVCECVHGALWVGATDDGGRISTDLDTITVPSPLLPHHFWPRLCCTVGNRKAQLSGRRFGQSGIKFRALFSHSELGVGTPRDQHCAFSHTSLRGPARILCLRKESGHREDGKRWKKSTRRPRI